MVTVQKYFTRTFASLKIRNYRLYFIGLTVSQCGTWMQTVAQGWLMLACQFLPMLLLSPMGGMLADRASKRRILSVTQSLAGIQALTMGILIASGSIEPWMLYIAALCIGTINAFDNPARQTFVSEMVGPNHLRNAITLNSTLNQLARAVGPTIAGILIAGVGVAFCYFVNAFSFLAVLIVLNQMDDSELFVAAKKQATAKSQGMRAALRYVARVHVIRNILLIVAIIGTFSYEFQVSLPMLAQNVFMAGAGGYAALLSAMGVGSVAGGLFAAGRKKVAPSQLIVSCLLFGSAMIITSRMPSFWWAVVGMMFVGFFSINLTSVANTIIQLETKPEMQGRVMALWTMAMLGSTPLGAPLVGWVGEYFGGRWGIGLGGYAAFFAGIIALLTLGSADRFRFIPSFIRHRGEKASIAEDIKLA
jgi:MFS family permease